MHTATSPQIPTAGTTRTIAQPDCANRISIVIPCYNHGKYVSEAINSVLEQGYQDVEVIVVDDGSTDNTKEVVRNGFANNEAVKYVYQNNQGLSAARNTGINHATGNYFVFLDADDWLVDNALLTNLAFLQQNEQYAFVSGGHIVINDRQHYREEKGEVIQGNHYNELLQRNYIGMHAAVMYRRWVFDEFRFDTSLRASEDYDMYLNIARKYPVHHHSKAIAVYRFHDSNMSGDIYKMFKYTLLVLGRQKRNLHSRAEAQCFSKGMHIWKDYYSRQLLLTLPHKPTWPLTSKMLSEHYIACVNHPVPYIKYLKSKAMMNLKKAKRRVKSFITKYGPGAIPAPGRVRMGDFNRTTPFSTDFGYDRGGPVDRYYIENFLAAQAGGVKGRVMEIGDNEYTMRFGGNKVTQSDILHINDSNPKATIVGDLSYLPQVPDNTFDCIILTQTLHLIYDYRAALQSCYRILKPGGVLLLTVPGISHIHHGEWGKYWMWSFTNNSLQRMLSEVFEPSKIAIETHGNVLAATAFLYAMGVSEIKQSQLNYNDPQYQVIITAAARK
jgi:glycosyltransferase involved in cell wall biosynthesis